MNKNKKIAIILLFIPLFLLIISILVSFFENDSFWLFFFIFSFAITPLTLGISVTLLLRDKTFRNSLKGYFKRIFNSSKRFVKKLKVLGRREITFKTFSKKILYIFLIPMALIISIGITIFDISLILDEILPQKKENTYITEREDNRKTIGDVDLGILDKKDEWLYRDADYFIDGVWEPAGYIEMNKEINMPEYEATLGSVIKDEWPIGKDDTLYLECEEIIEAYLVPPAWPICSLQVNNHITIDNYVRSEFFCDDYGDYTNPTDCKLTVGMILYSRDNLEEDYLFLSSAEYYGSNTGVLAYKLRGDDFQKMYFDDRGYITDGIGGRGDMSIVKLVYNKDSKYDIRLISRLYDPSFLDMHIGAIYSEWKILLNKFEVDKRIVSIWKGDE